MGLTRFSIKLVIATSGFTQLCPPKVAKSLLLLLKVFTIIQMDSVKDILATKNLDEPTEAAALREYCQELFDFKPKISIKKDTIWMSVPNGILATELRMRQPEINRRCQLTKKLVIRIG